MHPPECSTFILVLLQYESKPDTEKGDGDTA